MSLFLLPRGVAARKAAGERKHAENDVSLAGMQIDVSTDQNKSTEETIEPPKGSSHRSRWNDTTSRTTYKQKSSKPIKPRDLATLIETSLSDYALWCNQDLRRFAGDQNTSGCMSIYELDYDCH
jgi:hypothetical protein